MKWIKRQLKNKVLERRIAILRLEIDQLALRDTEDDIDRAQAILSRLKEIAAIRLKIE